MVVMSKYYWQTLMALCLAFGALFGARAADITGAGASFPYPVYAKWAALYYQQTGHRVNYQSIGSGGGQQQVIAGTVDFGASDDPMDEDLLAQYALLQFPAVVGGIVPIVNIPGLQPGQLRLTGAVLADIFLGVVEKWDDPKIQQLNPELQLPSRSIVVVHRSDGSGTSFAWTNYLAQVSVPWRQIVGQGKAVKWPAGHGGKGNEGVAAYVSQLDYSIGYVEYAYAKHSGLAWVQLQNRAGNFVQPSEQSFAAAARHANWSSVAGMGVVLNNQPGAQTWPISAASFILIPKNAKNPQKTQEVRAFFEWAWAHGDAIALQLSYVPLPAELVQEIQQQWLP